MDEISPYLETRRWWLIINKFVYKPALYLFYWVV